MTVYTTLPTDDLNLSVTVIDDPDLVVLNITPTGDRDWETHYLE